jgi:hypothetical protein
VKRHLQSILVVLIVYIVSILAVEASLAHLRGPSMVVVRMDSIHAALLELNARTLPAALSASAQLAFAVAGTMSWALLLALGVLGVVKMVAGIAAICLRKVVGR